MKLVTFRDIESSDIGMKDCVEWVAEAIKAKGDAILPPKISLNPGIEGVFANFMPCIVKDAQGRSWGGVKMVTRYPGRFPSLDSKLILFDADNGDVLALMDADWITTMRTGAVAAHSIDLRQKAIIEPSLSWVWAIRRALHCSPCLNIWAHDACATETL